MCRVGGRLKKKKKKGKEERVEVSSQPARARDILAKRPSIDLKFWELILFNVRNNPMVTDLSFNG